MTPEEIKRRLLEADDLRIEEVPTPEWAEAGLESVHVRNLSLAEASRLRDCDSEEEAEVLAVSLGLCDDQGTSLGFSEAELALLAQKSAGPAGRCRKRIYDLSYLTPASMETVEGNSQGTGSGSSG